MKAWNSMNSLERNWVKAMKAKVSTSEFSYVVGAFHSSQVVVVQFDVDIYDGSLSLVYKVSEDLAYFIEVEGFVGFFTEEFTMAVHTMVNKTFTGKVDRYRITEESTHWQLM